MNTQLQINYKKKWYVLKNSLAVKNWYNPNIKLAWWKSCEIQAGGQELAVVIAKFLITTIQI